MKRLVQSFGGAAKNELDTDVVVSPMNRARAASVVAGIASVLALAQTVRLHCASRTPPGPLTEKPSRKPSPDPPTDGRTSDGDPSGAKAPSVPLTDGKTPDENPPGARKAGWRWSAWFLLVASVIFAVGAAWLLSHTAYHLAAGILGIAALASSSFILRGPRFRYDAVVTPLAYILFMLVLLISLVGTISTIFESTTGTLIPTGPHDPTAAATLIGLTIFGTVSLAIALCLAVTWLPNWRFAEPLAIAIVALFFLVICVPGLQSFVQLPVAPRVDGAGMLFVADEMARPHVTLDVHTNPRDTPQDRERFIVTNETRKNLKWALLIVGDAALRGCISATHPGSACTDLHVKIPQTIVLAPAASGQLLWGTLGPRSHVAIEGKPSGTFIDKTIPRTAVSLPQYGLDPDLLVDLDDNVSPKVAALIRQRLGGSPPADNPDLTVHVYGDALQASESVREATPAPDTPDTLRWTTHTAIQVSYSTVNQNEVDAATNVTFVLAILLGVAAAGILTSMQSLIQKIQDPERNKSRRT